MCGRFTLRTLATVVARQFELFQPVELAPRYNIAPTQPVAIVRLATQSPQRELAQLRWGLVPAWADDPQRGPPLVNARAETTATKPAFRQAYLQRRCLIPADGFFEWAQADKDKRPLLIHLQDDALFAFAGLWEHWEHGSQRLETCTIITTEANDKLRSIHDRMPVILLPAAYGTWLDPASDADRDLEPLLRPLSSEFVHVRPVSKVVNSARRDGPECIAPPNEIRQQQLRFGDE